MSNVKTIIKTLVATAVVAVLVLIFWSSVTLIWYPKYDEMDITAITQEADQFFASCDASTTEFIINVALNETNAPNIFNLESHDVENGQIRINCESGLRLKLWDDLWVSGAGLYIVRAGYELPSEIKPYATLLEPRVYTWHGGDD